MSQRNAVQRAYDQFGREAGFEKKSGSWYHRSDEVISVTNLQKSQYGPRYYLNQAFWLRSEGEDLFPKEWKCHVRTRLEDLLPDQTDRINRLLDLECDVPDEVRVQQLGGLLTDRLLPIIKQSSSVDGLRTLVDAGVVKDYLLTGPAQRVLAAVRE